MSNFDLIDDYLRGKLKGDTMNNFEQQLKSDPALKAEVEIQHSIIESIKKARTKELKSMLNNVPVSATTRFFDGAMNLKIAASLIGAGILITSLYFYLKPENLLIGPKDISTSLKDSLNDSTPITNGSVEIEEKQTVQEQPVDLKEKENKAVISKEKTENTSVSPIKPAINVVDPSKEMITEGNNGAMEKTSNLKPSVISSKVMVDIDNSGKKYDFHYQFLNDRLILYGNFGKDLYEILEINGAARNSMFLYFNKKYYLLNQDQHEIKSLVAIDDKALILKLNEYHNQ